MIKLEYLISVLADYTEILVRKFEGNQPIIFLNETVDAFKQSLYDTYKDNQVAYIEPHDYGLIIYIAERKI